MFKLICSFSNIDSILHAQEKVWLPNALVHVNDNGDFFTRIINTSTISKILNCSDLTLEPNYENEPIFYFNPGKFSKPNNTQNFYDKNQLPTKHFEHTFYTEENSFTFTNEIEHSNE